MPKHIAILCHAQLLGPEYSDDFGAGDYRYMTLNLVGAVVAEGDDVTEEDRGLMQPWRWTQPTDVRVAYQRCVFGWPCG